MPILVRGEEKIDALGCSSGTVVGDVAGRSTGRVALTAVRSIELVDQRLGCWNWKMGLAIGSTM